MELANELNISSPVQLSASENETIHLTKNSKGYNWEVKLVGTIDDKLLARLQLLSETLNLTYCPGI